MPSSVMLLAVAAILVAAIVLLLLAPSGPPRGGEESYDHVERRHMPPEIAEARMVLSEELIRVRVPARIVAKPDQVYLTRQGLLVLVETKTRHSNQVRDFDRAEISVQAFAMRHGRPGRLKRHPVAPYGYIRIKREGLPPAYHRVALHSDVAVVAMRQRRIDIESQRVAPGGPVTPRICRTCGKRPTCPRQLAG